MSGKHKRGWSDERDSAADDRRGKDMNDLELIVEGRKVNTDSSLLSYNSDVFATLITNARAARADDDDLMGMNSYQTGKSPTGKLKLEIPNLNYKDVKLMVACLQSAGVAKEEVTGVKALRILPLVEQFRMKHLKRVCGKALFESLTAMRKDHGPGCLPARDVLQYLAAADLYNFDKVRKLCVEELAVTTDASNRKLIQRDKHINEKTKLRILDKMCDNMDQKYQDKLKQVRSDMDERCRKIEQRRDEFMEQLETWKADLRQEVDDMVSSNVESHKQLSDDLYKQRIVSRMDETLRETKEGLFKEMEEVRDSMNFVLETMESNDVTDYRKSLDLADILVGTMGVNKRNIERIADGFKQKIDQTLATCSLSTASVGVFSSATNLEENVCRNIEELEEKIKTMAINQIKYEEEVMAHKATKAELMKMKMKEHEINTWLKWAKPATDNEEKCQCFRHAASRK